ncbi:IucA/IucC family protein [Kitasatospora purpeofusca]|uniref:IucA/IucC family protein n=1 Tax=Kitasatospora purpeofusca TaxID=67352 RepID=UPI0022538072|nr:IucA/IucC family protein [Kitasatospora purpeofusca]MCX4756792.1 IucA/IucC family siderophore biosynthesis protein [Kitasatospora purpeofusca]WSR35425.1 IucA/IucC family siderophore biosynthesis protein [Kitasatospora purpeofusca]WSR43745.1 IucA/IucC family siderophore biosynthesis protein [Kitasatospora purpeofusca]
MSAATTPSATSTPATTTPAGLLALRVLSTLVREDVLGLRTRGTVEHRADGAWLVAAEHGIAVPVAAEGFQSEYGARLPLVEVDGRLIGDLDAALTALAAHADAEDRPGWAAFAEECRQTLATMELHERVRAEVHTALTDLYGADPAHWTGPAAALGHDTLAAFLDHPVYPTARGRSGLDEHELRSHAPEFHPAFELRWLALPAGTLTRHGDRPLPRWWPTPSWLGLDLPGGDAAWETLPVHPLTVGPALEEALRATGLDGRAVLAERPYLTVVPTLSMRTVAVAENPLHHLKLPLATATLGRLNRRTIKPGTLVDGAAGQRLVEAVLAREPRFAGRILHADEQTWAHAGHELLAVLLRRYPEGLERSVTVPLAALLAPAPASVATRGHLVVDRLADRFHGGDPVALYDALLELLLDWQTTLFGHGVALESHQQNTSLVLDQDGGLRLLYKDDDGPRVHTGRMTASLGELSPAREEFDDVRIFGDDDRRLTDLFTTITGHLCAGSLAFGLAAHGRAGLDELLVLLRKRLTEAVERTGPAAEPLRAALLDADRLPVKAMVTAGTLLSKQRSGAADINKHYTDGPNYLMPQQRSANEPGPAQ